MSSGNEIFVFDAADYPGFERAVRLSKKSPLTLDERIEGIATIVIFAVVLLYLLSTGLLEQDPESFVLILGVAVVLAGVIMLILLRLRVLTARPVRITQDDMILFGKKRWPLSDIKEIVAWGGFGAVELKDPNGKTIALIERAQFGSYDDFLMVVGKLHPEIKVERACAAVKMRLANE